MTPAREIDLEGLEARVAALPGFALVRDTARARDLDAYLVGGSVRDALLGVDHGDLDVTVAGDHMALVEALGGEARIHDRFGTAAVSTSEGEVDVARARAESYAASGALPDVRPAGIEEDLARRDFTINALAVPLAGPFELLDPHGGAGDLAAGLLRVLHPRSFEDDPTRALRGARYVSRLGLEAEPETLGWLRATNLAAVSGERLEAELRLLAAEPAPRRGFELLAEWELGSLPAGAGELIDGLVELLADEPWTDTVNRVDAVLEAARSRPSERALALAAANPAMPSEGVELAHGATPVELAHARVLDAAWLDEYMRSWRHVRLEISGTDLIAAGIEQGPAVGAGLAAALRAKLDGEAGSGARELEVALEAAGEEI